MFREEKSKDSAVASGTGKGMPREHCVSSNGEASAGICSPLPGAQGKWHRLKARATEGSLLREVVDGEVVVIRFPAQPFVVLMKGEIGCR